MAAELRLEFDSLEALRREHEQNLRHGRAFVPGASGLALFAECTLRLVRGDGAGALDLKGRVIMIGEREPMRGIAVELVEPSWSGRLAEWMALPSADAVAQAEPEAPQTEAVEVEAVVEAETTVDEVSEADHGDPAAVSKDRNRHLRALSPAERTKVAQGSNMAERVLVERLYGGAVWEALLHCPHITLPEVARIARKGTLPRPLVELIVENPNWVRQDIVRRALLTNPRVSPDGITKILRATPPRELKLVQHQTAYPAQVRAMARKLVGE